MSARHRAAPLTDGGRVEAADSSRPVRPARVRSARCAARVSVAFIASPTDTRTRTQDSCCCCCGSATQVVVTEAETVFWKRICSNGNGDRCPFPSLRGEGTARRSCDELDVPEPELRSGFYSVLISGEHSTAWIEHSN